MTNHTRKPAAAKTNDDLAASYNAFKEFEGRRYTGMKIGRSHKWYYDQGEWKEKKITPDQWEISYTVTKRRAGKAPEGSGVPVGTAYHWYILAHQNVTKLNANDYSTSLNGFKFKLAYKRADRDKWSAGPRAQRNHMIKLLRQMADELELQAAEEARQPATARKASRDKPAVARPPAKRRQRRAPPQRERAA